MAVLAMAAPQITEAAVAAVPAQLVAMEPLAAVAQEAREVPQVFLAHQLLILLAVAGMVVLAQPRQPGRLTAVMAHWRGISPPQAQQAAPVS
jgi:hypothetical protein